MEKTEGYREVPFDYNDKKYKGYLLDSINVSKDFDWEQHSIEIILVPELMSIFKEETYHARNGEHWENKKLILNFSSNIKLINKKNLK